MTIPPTCPYCDQPLPRHLMERCPACLSSLPRVPPLPASALAPLLTRTPGPFPPGACGPLRARVPQVSTGMPARRWSDPGRATLVAMLLIVPGVAINCALTSQPQKWLGMTIGTLTLSMMLAGLVGLVAAAIMAACKRGFAGPLRRCYAVGILTMGVLTLVGQVVGGVVQTLRRNEASADAGEVAAIQEDFRTMTREVERQADSPSPGTLRLQPATAPASSDMQRLRKFMQECFNDQVSLQNQYRAELEAAGLSSLLKAERLAGDKGFEESHAMLAKLDAVVSTNRNKAIKLATEVVPQRLKEVKFTSATDRSILAGYQQSMKSTLPQLQQIWDLETQIMGHMRELINLLESSREYWDSDQGRFMFQRGEDHERFNALLAQINACTQQQAAIRQRVAKEAASKMEAFGK